MLKVSIVGNIASGKSSVEKILTEFGYKVFDADLLAHKVLDEQSEIILKEFSKFDILDNKKISRKKLGNVVFQNIDMKKKLESITHPAIKNKIYEIFKQNKNEKFVFISVPLLFEVGWQDMFDKIIFIQTDDTLRLERLMKRNNLTKEEALIRMNSQVEQEKKVKLADFIVCNNDNIMGLKNKIEQVIISIEDNGEK